MGAQRAPTGGALVRSAVSGVPVVLWPFSSPTDGPVTSPTGPGDAPSGAMILAYTRPTTAHLR